MERKVVYEDKNLRLEYVPEGNYIHETWWGRTPRFVFEKLLKEVVKALEENKATGLLLDAREHMGLGPDSQKLAAETIADYARKHGKIREAIIVPKDVFSDYSVRNYSQQVTQKGPVETRFFDQIADAENWLKSTG